MIPFAAWTPDQPDFENQGLIVTNARPIAKGYQSFSALSEQTDALDGRCLGGISMRATDASGYIFAGDSTKLYSLADTSWSNVSQAGNYALNEGDFWEFAQFHETILCVTKTENIQYYTPGSSSLFADRNADLQAATIAVVRDFVVVGNTYDSADGQQPWRVRWSAIGDETDWTVSAVTGSDFQTMPSGGWVQRIIGGEFGLVFCESKIYRMTYVGPPAIFQFDDLESAKGTIAPQSVIKIGGLVYYLAADGFYACDGVQSVSIGAEIVNRFFFADVRDVSIGKVVAGYDREKNCVYWAYENDDDVDGNNDSLLVYHIQTNKWAKVSVGVEVFGSYRTTSYTPDLDYLLLETGDLLLYEDSGSMWLDELAAKYWTGADDALAPFSVNHKLGFFDGDPLTAVLTTGEFQPVPGKRSRVTRLWPLVDGGTLTARIGSRGSQADSVAWTSSGARRTSGSVSLRANGRYHRAEITISGGFNDAVGIDAEFVPEGRQ